ncbi:MAG: V-type ATP synthase subunit K [Trueperaceae bacterium]|nr:V-type ATP synthase subunit K [Trueperaceae bacterium]
MKKVLKSLALVAVFAVLASFGLAQEGASIGSGLIAIGAGLAIGISAIGVGIAQAAIGSAGAGTLAERPQAFGQILIYLVIPETLIIFGFVIAFFLNARI